MVSEVLIDQEFEHGNFKMDLAKNFVLNLLCNLVIYAVYSNSFFSLPYPVKSSLRCISSV